MKTLLSFLGIVSLALGIAGIFLPLLPTTPFLLLSAWLFVRSSPRLYAWLTNHPRLGPYIRNFRENRAIPLRVEDRIGHYGVAHDRLLRRGGVDEWLWGAGGDGAARGGNNRASAVVRHAERGVDKAAAREGPYGTLRGLRPASVGGYQVR